MQRRQKNPKIQKGKDRKNYYSKGKSKKTGKKKPFKKKRKREDSSNGEDELPKKFCSHYEKNKELMAVISTNHGDKHSGTVSTIAIATI